MLPRGSLSPVLVLVLISTQLHTSWGGGDGFDVTTVYDLGPDNDINDGHHTHSEELLLSILDVPGRVHMRTNSMGLPLYNQTNDNVLTPVSKGQPLNISCYFGDWDCGWKAMQGWTLIEEDAIAGKPYKVSKIAKIVLKNNNNNYNYDSRFLTFFTSDKFNTGRRYKTVIYIDPENSYPVIYDECTLDCCGIKQFSLTRISGVTDVIYCSSSTIKYTKLTSRYPVELAFKYNATRVNSLIWSSHRETTSIDFSEKHLLNDNDMYVSMSDNNNFDSWAPKIQFPVFTSSREGAVLESPVFELRNRMFFCLSLMVQTPDVAAAHHQEGALLQVTLKDVVRNTQVNQNVSDIKVEWNVKQIKFHFTRQVTGSYKLVIKTTSLQTVHVSQITICNEDGEDVYSLPPTSLPYKHLPKTKDRDEPLLPIYAARNPLTTVVDDDVTNTPGNTTSGSCLNGGVPSGWSCRCPPGFTGDNCQLGCGRNRFGQDCGGRCSFRVGECRGLLLCNDATKCQCAPGYTGDQCDQSCRGGVYGNDCLQRCGNCADDVYSCDKYTGECAGCQPGYRLPHCTLPHVYYPLKPELSSLEYGVIKVTFDPKRFASSDDQPQLYQIQFREKDSSWRVLTTKSLKEEIKENNITIEESIGNLKTGQLYEVRVLLLDASFNKYDGSLVQNAEILTKCEIPEDYDYKVKYSSNTSSYTFTWTYSNTSDHWCPVECYEVSWKDNYRWLSENTTLNSFTLASRLSGLTTEFEVQAKTTGGAAPHSKPLYASTLHSGTFSVRNLRMVSSQSTSLKLAWEPPNYSDGQVLSYNIKYKCVDQPACSPGCFNATEGALSQQDTSVILSSLLPFAQYQVSVTPDNGPESRIFVGTSKVVPGEKPLLSEKNKIERANTSLTVFWEPVPVCSGFMLGYNYQLAKESEPLRVVVGGFTRGTSFAFHNLSASTAYVVKVYIVTVAGWNPDAYLEINTSTSATVPEAVQQLTVYKKGRSVLGLRWAAPKAMYGHLKSFTVTVAHAPGHSDEQSRTVEPKRCTAWPDLYCHTIEALRPNRNYTVSVSTRNSEVAEDGAVASVWAVTKEAPPTAPVGLRLSNASETSVGLRWEHPDLANGLLRSFLVSVEETERFDQDACCQVYPLIETPVTEENQTYEAEVSGLQPAATYYVSVSAKTVGLGPAQSLVVHTRPPHLPLATVLPSLEGLWDGKVTWQTPRLQADAINSSDVYAPLVKARLLLAVVNETAENVSGIFDTQLDSLLRKNIGKPFVFVAEYTEGDVATDLLIYNDGPAADSEWGRGIIGLSSDDILGLVAAQIAGYNGAYNADLVLTTATGTNNDSS